MKGQRTKTRERTNSGSSHQHFHVNEPFFPDGVYKTNKFIIVFYKKQVNKFIRVKP